MHLHDVSNSLPRVLRDSNLPWVPDHEGQAAAPTDDDGWSLTFGYLRFRLSVDWDWLFTKEGPPGLPDFNLFLENLMTGKELGSWTFQKLEIAVAVAETLHDERINNLCNRLKEQLHDVAA
jgi:hypothetical protein